jgi:raffinose/stachyose/melibiose transport system permease protein
MAAMSTTHAEPATDAAGAEMALRRSLDAPHRGGRRGGRARPRASLLVELSMVVPALAVFVALLVVPVGYAVYYSFTDYNGFPTQTPQLVGFDNYVEVFDSPDVTGAMVVTAVVAVVGSLLVNALALGLALLLWRTTRFTAFARVVMFYPHVLSLIVVGFLSDETWALGTLVCVIAWAQFGVQLLIYLAGLQAVPGELIEASRIDGANRWHTFRHVTWPALGPSVTVALVTSMISLLKTYDIVVSLTGGGPAGSTKTFAYQILAVEFPKRQVGLASAEAVVLILVAAILAFGLIALRRRADEAAA